MKSVNQKTFRGWACRKQVLLIWLLWLSLSGNSLSSQTIFGLNRCTPSMASLMPFILVSKNNPIRVWKCMSRTRKFFQHGTRRQLGNGKKSSSFGQVFGVTSLVWLTWGNKSRPVNIQVFEFTTSDKNLDKFKLCQVLPQHVIHMSCYSYSSSGFGRQFGSVL